MSWRYLNAAWEDLDFESAAQKFVLVALADFSSEDGEAWPAISTLAARTMLSRSTVKRCLAWLTDHQKIELLPGKGRGNTHRIKLVHKTVHPEPLSGDKTVHPEPVSELKGFTMNDKRVHPAHKRVQALNHNPLDPSLIPQEGGVARSPVPGNKGRQLTPQQLFWMINERLKSATGLARKKLEAERDLVLTAATGIDLSPPATQPQPFNPVILESPPSEEEWNAGIAALKSVVASATPARPLPKPTPNRKVHFPIAKA